MDASDIRISEWPPQANQPVSSQHALFNSESLAAAGRLDGNEPFCISIDGNQYLAFKRNASAVVGGMSLADMSVLLNDISLVQDALVAMAIRSISFTSWNAENNPDIIHLLANRNCQTRFEFLLDTDQYSINKISSNHKRNIKKSQKANAEVTFPVDPATMRSHIELVNANLSQKGVGGLTNSPEYFYTMVEQGAGLLVQVNAGDQLLASTFFYANRDYCYYHSSGTDERGKQVGAAHFLVDRVIAEMRKREIRYLNLGGCTSDQSGLYRFKLGFRPETRILLSAKRRLISDVRHKLRSLLSINPKDILKTATVQVFVKSGGEPASGDESGYLFRKLSFDKLFDGVASNPELAPSLALFCRPSAECYGLYSGNEQLIALGFINAPGADPQLGAIRSEMALGFAEIADVCVLQGMRNKGIGTALLAHLEEEATKRGYCRVFSRIDDHNVAAQKLFLTRDFLKRGEEKLVSTALLPGKQRIIGKVDI